MYSRFSWQCSFFLPFRSAAWVIMRFCGCKWAKLHENVDEFTWSTVSNNVHSERCIPNKTKLETTVQSSAWWWKRVEILIRYKRHLKIISNNLVHQVYIDNEKRICRINKKIWKSTNALRVHEYDTKQRIERLLPMRRKNGRNLRVLMPSDCAYW